MFHGSNVFSINHPDIPDVRVNTATIDDDYLDAMKFELIEGRGFNPEYNDSLSIVINEAARDAMGVESALGYKFGGGGNSPETSPEFYSSRSGERFQLLFPSFPGEPICHV